MTVQALLDLITALSASVDTLIAKAQPADLTPVADALNALKTKVDAAAA